MMENVESIAEVKDALYKAYVEYYKSAKRKAEVIEFLGKFKDYKQSDFARLRDIASDMHPTAIRDYLLERVEIEIKAQLESALEHVQNAIKDLFDVEGFVEDPQVDPVVELSDRRSTLQKQLRDTWEMLPDPNPIHSLAQVDELDQLRRYDELLCDLGRRIDALHPHPEILDRTQRGYQQKKRKRIAAGLDGIAATLDSLSTGWLPA